MNDEVLSKEYDNYVKYANCEPPVSDEYATLAAYDAVTAAYGLDSYPLPRKRRQPKHPPSAAQSGGISLSLDGDPPCRE